MSDSPITTLPPEALHQILKYLPIATLFRFGQTSKFNYSVATVALQTLRLAILPRHLHGVLAFLSSSTFDDVEVEIGDSRYDNPCRNQVIVTSPLPPFNGPPRSKTKLRTQPAPAPAYYREKLFHLQNALACSILSTPNLAGLTFLTLHVYHITSSALTEILATLLPNLRELRLNFYHPYLHDTCLPGQYWTNPVFLEPSPIWNTLAGVGNESNSNLKLMKLEKLTVERAGITSSQLRNWIERNPNLCELRLRNVAGVDAEFVQWLGTYYRPHGDKKSDVVTLAKLRTLAFESCSALAAESVEELSWLDSLFGIGSDEFSDHENTSALQVLSLRSSTSIQTTALCAYLESKRPAIQKVTLPDGRVLGPRWKNRKQSRSEASHKQPSASGPSNSNTKPQTGTIQPSPYSHDADDHIAHSVDMSAININVQALSIDGDNSEDDDSTDDESSPSSSPVPYLRLTNRCRPRKGCQFPPNDIIEPDPNAI